MTAVTPTARERHAAALRPPPRPSASARTETVIRQLIKDKQQINFRSAARAYAGIGRKP